MICYHTTGASGAILRDGFRDATGSYMCVNYEFTGVWLSDQILDVNEGAKGDEVLRVDFPDSVDLDVPAALINEHATVALMSDDEVVSPRVRRFMDANPGFQLRTLPGWEAGVAFEQGGSHDRHPGCT